MDESKPKKTRRPAPERAVELVGSLSLADLAQFAEALRTTNPEVAAYVAERLT